MSKVTPMMQQFFDIKKNYPDTILFFRMGDFYEMFGQDAEDASKILGIALTSRDKQKDGGIPMCGIPYHSYQPYLVKLLKAGKNVAVCEQLEDPSKAKGIVKRGVVQVVTPGTVLDDAALNSAANNFVASVIKEGNEYFTAFIDISTGEVYLENSVDAAETLGRWSPTEVISMDDLEIKGFVCSTVDAKLTDESSAKRLQEHYEAASVKSLGIDKKGFSKALALSLIYFKRLMIDVRLKRPVTVAPENRLVIDSIAARTLELVENSNDGSERSTLFSILNHTKTSMGGRLLKNWLLNPLRERQEILRRQEMVEFFLYRSDIRWEFQNLLSSVYDMERITARLLAGRCGARDLVWLKNSIGVFPQLKELMNSSGNPHLEETASGFDSLDGIHSVIDHALVEEPPVNLKEGGLIKEGYNKDVDEYRTIRKDSRKLLMRIEKEEKEKTGIHNLKVKFNKVFGYYIEVSKSQINKVPDYYDRKQTLVNAERYIIPELKELEGKLVYAEERLGDLEYTLFSELRDTLAGYAEMIRTSAEIVAEMDVLISLAESASLYGYTRPVLNEDEDLVIKGGRHPVVERNIPESYVPNDLFLNDTDSRMAVITGPNMAGKSTYLRMSALVALMAHIGSFVPASESSIPLLDRIFTRVGASDNLAGGESTFMVEMVETANILGNATEKSLIILDEIGRGTSTFDGISIAWSVAEYILKEVKAKTLFATHYHELTDIPASVPGAKNWTTEVREWKDEVIFMRRVVEGTADRSYGIHVAKLAGLPDYVTKRSNELLTMLEKNEFGADGQPKLARTAARERKVIQPMLVFDDSPVVDELKNLDINGMTPLEALSMLDKLKKMAEE